MEAFESFSNYGWKNVNACNFECTEMKYCLHKTKKLTKYFMSTWNASKIFIKIEKDNFLTTTSKKKSK